MLWRQLDFVKELVPWVFVVQIVYASIQFIASVCLLVGIVKNKAGLMKPWLFLTMFTLLVSHEFLTSDLTNSSFLMSEFLFPGWICNSLHGFCSHGFGHPWRHLVRHDLVFHGYAILAFGILLLVRSKSCLLGNPQGGNTYLANALSRGKEISTDVNWRSFHEIITFVSIHSHFVLSNPTTFVLYLYFDTEWCFCQIFYFKVKSTE